MLKKLQKIKRKFNSQTLSKNAQTKEQIFKSLIVVPRSQPHGPRGPFRKSNLTPHVKLCKCIMYTAITFQTVVEHRIKTI